jgi:hypothetical protein
VSAPLLPVSMSKRAVTGSPFGSVITAGAMRTLPSSVNATAP